MAGAPSNPSSKAPAPGQLSAARSGDAGKLPKPAAKAQPTPAADKAPVVVAPTLAATKPLTKPPAKPSAKAAAGERCHEKIAAAPTRCGLAAATPAQSTRQDTFCGYGDLETLGNTATFDALRIPAATVKKMKGWAVRFDAADARETAAWRPTHELRFANVKSVATEPGANWSKLWEKATGSGAAAFKCCAADCAANALDCSHVWVEGLAVGRVVGVVPMCADHMNHKKHPKAMAMRAGTNVMLMNAHAAYRDGPTQAGSKCL